MASQSSQRGRGLGFEELEARVANSVTPLLQESFDSAGAGRLPSGWSQWSNNGSTAFGAIGLRSVSGAMSLGTTAASTTTARTWLNATQPADVQVAATLYADSLVPVQLFSRGRGLDTAAPSYYAAQVTRGLNVQLVRVSHGTSTVLGQLSSAEYFVGRWVQVTLSAQGNQLKVQVYRSDTRQYLTSAGKWQTAQAWALERTDGAIGGAGQTGMARLASYAGTITADDFRVSGFTTSPPPTGPTPPPTTTPNGTVRETFDSAGAGRLPSSWSQWSSNGAPAFGAVGLRSVSGAMSLGTTAASTTTARTWLNATQPADVQVAATLYADSLVPVQLFARGRSLDTPRPTYYAAQITRGLNVQLVRVSTGVSTVLGQLSTAQYLEGRWVQVTLSAQGSRLRVQLYRPDTRQYLNASGQWQTAQAWALERTDGTITGAGQAGLARVAAYAGLVVVDDFAVTPLGSTTPPPTTPPPTSPPPTTPPPTTPGLPTVPRHYRHIRVAQLAYSGTPLGAFEDQLLRNSVDLVITDTPYLSEHIDAVSPNTPQLGYINYSSIYQELYLDWLSYADARRVSRESAFYHVRRATPFSGDSPSSQPVNWFWSVLRGGQSPRFQDLTTQAHIGGEDFAFGGNVGESTYLGYPEKFREINLMLAQDAGPGWAAWVEYPTQVDSFGNPTAWDVIRATYNNTAGLTRSGIILWDPPANWQPASLGGSERLYFVRLRTITPGPPPVASLILGRDYVNAQGTTRGVIPAFDSAADLDGDGYLNDAEYARRAPGMDARFVYESRLFYGHYGQMRFAANPANASFRSWAVDYAQRYLRDRPRTDGLFVDNSVGDPLVAADVVAESLANYAADYGSLLASVGRAIAPRWILANTSGAGSKADEVVRQNPAYYEEFALRPLAHSWQFFEDVAAIVAHRAQLRPNGYAILDTLPTGGSPTDPRTQLAALAYYYLIADPDRTFLNLNGGYEPGTSWTRHWSGAVAYDIGRPTSTWSIFASGADPNDIRYGYRIYQRRYDNALVLYKPLSSRQVGYGIGGLSDNTATVHNLNGTYRPLRADGTLGAPITRIALRNGEGAILVRA